MCKTTQYLYTCSHRATRPFHTALCEVPRSKRCRITNADLVLPYDCPVCSRRGRADLSLHFPPRPSPPSSLYNNVWYIPSRSFVDVGFRTLDPFKTDKGGDDDWAESTEPESENTTPNPNMHAAKKSVKHWRLKGLAKRQRTKASPSCAKKNIDAGAHETTRLEGCEDQADGRMEDSKCRSLL